MSNKNNNSGCSLLPFVIFLIANTAIFTIIYSIIGNITNRSSNESIPEWLVILIIAITIIEIILFYHKSTNRSTITKSIAEMTGLEYEQYVADTLRDGGYRHVRVTRGSGDFGADVICEDPSGRSVCIQCKKYSGNVGIKAVQEVFSAKGYYGCDYAMVITNSTFTSAAQELASRTGVKLWDHFT